MVVGGSLSQNFNEVGLDPFPWTLSIVQVDVVRRGRGGTASQASMLWSLQFCLAGLRYLRLAAGAKNSLRVFRRHLSVARFLGVWPRHAKALGEGALLAHVALGAGVASLVTAFPVLISCRGRQAKLEWHRRIGRRWHLARCVFFFNGLGAAHPKPCGRCAGCRLARLCLGKRRLWCSPVATLTRGFARRGTAIRFNDTQQETRGEGPRQEKPGL